MPIYEYKCLSCDNVFEVKQKFSAAPIKVCPECGGKVKKIIHAPGIVFKGTGWYQTDFPSKDRKKKMEDEKQDGE